MKCPTCRNNVIQKGESDPVLRFRIEEKSLCRAQDGTIRAKCFWCKSEIILPLELESPERFVIREPSA